MSYEKLAEGSVVTDTRNDEEMEVVTIKDSGVIVWSDGVSETPSSVRDGFDSGDYKIS